MNIFDSNINLPRISYLFNHTMSAPLAGLAASVVGGMAGGFAGGVVGGFANGTLQGQSFGKAMGTGLVGGMVGGALGGVAGGLLYGAGELASSALPDNFLQRSGLSCEMLGGYCPDGKIADAITSTAGVAKDAPGAFTGGVSGGISMKLF